MNWLPFSQHLRIDWATCLQRITAMWSFFMEFKNRNMKEALNELEHIEEWLNSLGPGWNYFGHVDRAKQRLKNAITLIKNAV